MASPREIAAQQYPGEKFEDDAAVYLRFSTDLVNAKHEFDFNRTTSIDLTGLVAVTEQYLNNAVSTVYKLAAYKLASESQLKDGQVGNRNELHKILFELSQGFITPDVENVLMTPTADPEDTLLVDALKLTPRTDEGRGLARIAGESEHTDIETAQLIDTLRYEIRETQE